MTIPKLLSIAVLLLSALISHVADFHGVGSCVRSSSSFLNMAPKFDKATQKWFPSNPEVTSSFLQKKRVSVYGYYAVYGTIKF